jgi:2-methylcitrate dehydratase PrpD
MTSVSLADWISGLSFEALPRRVRSRAKLAVFDACGTTLAGTHHPATQHVRRLIADMGSTPQVRVIGDPSLRVSQLDAAWLLGTMADAYLYSDVHVPSGGHFTSVLLPVLLAVSEVREISGPEALTAYVAGYEVATRLAAVVDSGRQHWHMTAVAGTMSAAAAAGRLLGLSPEQLRHAFVLAAGEATGGDGSAMQSGRTARSGLLSALLAGQGLSSGDVKAGEELAAWLALFGDGSFQADRLLNGWGDDFALDRAELHFKLYPTASSAHGFIDAALALHQQNVTPDQVRRLVCRVGPPAAPALSFAPTSPQQAQHNLPYAVAVALCDGRVGLAQFNPSRVSADEVQALMGRIEVEQDASCETPDRFASPAVLRAELNDGRSVVETVEHARGSPQRPPTRPEFEAKFRQCAAVVLSTERTLLAARCLYQLDTLPDLRALMDTLSVAARS